MPGTVKSGLLPDADRSHKCDSRENNWEWIRPAQERLNLPLDKSHFITDIEKVAEHRGHLLWASSGQKGKNWIILYDIKFLTKFQEISRTA